MTDKFHCLPEYFGICWLVNRNACVLPFLPAEINKRHPLGIKMVFCPLHTIKF